MSLLSTLWGKVNIISLSDSSTTGGIFISEEERVGLGEIIDRLISVPVFTGPTLAKRPSILDLYEAARSKFKKPLTFLATEKLVGVLNPRSTVIITTGFIVPPWLAPETDGPVGSVTLARALNLAFDITPVIVTEGVLINRMSKLCEVAGFRVYDLSRAKELPRRLAVEGFPLEEGEAETKAVEMIEEVDPVAVIAIEKGSKNEKGVYHSGIGMDVSPLAAKVDFLFEEARSRGILTIGIGDGGNEIGMGCIKDAVKKHVSTGAQCRCPCGAGTHAATETDVLVVAGVSNWGAYGLEACLAHRFKKMELLHNGEMERTVLREAGRLGFIDPASGFGEPSADAIPENIHVSMVEILNFIVRSRIYESIYIQKYREYNVKRRTEILEKIKRWKEHF